MGPLPSGQYAPMNSPPGADDLNVVIELCKAIDAGDERACAALLAADVTYTFVSQGEYRGRDDVVRAFLAGLETMTLTRDWFTADGSGRVWWRYRARWTDAETGGSRSTTGATAAHVEGGLVRSVMSWIDVLAAGADAS